MTDALALVDYAARLAIAGLLLWYVVEFLPMPGHMRRVTQGLIVLVLVLAVLRAIASPAAAPPPGPPPGTVPPNPSTPWNPSIIR